MSCRLCTDFMSSFDIHDRLGYYRFHVIHSDQYVVSFGIRESCKGFYNSESSTYRPRFLFNVIVCRNTEGRGRGSTLKIEGASVCEDYGLLYDESGESTKTLGNFVRATFAAIRNLYDNLLCWEGRLIVGFLAPDLWKETGYTAHHTKSLMTVGETRRKQHIINCIIACFNRQSPD
jgi:hypothetical protein